MEFLVTESAVNITFIKPSMFGSYSKDAMYPLIFAIVKAITPKNIKISFYDERVDFKAIILLKS